MVHLLTRRGQGGAERVGGGQRLGDDGRGARREHLLGLRRLGGGVADASAGRPREASAAVTYEWRVAAAAGDAGGPDAATLAALDALPAAASLSRPSLVLPAGALPAGSRYAFELYATSDDGRLGYAAVELLMRRPPRDGHFIVNPSEGTVGETVFTLRCKEWVADNTDDLPLTYSFYARPPGAVVRRATARALAAQAGRVAADDTTQCRGHKALRARESGGRRDDHVHDRGQPPMGANVS